MKRKGIKGVIIFLLAIAICGGIYIPVVEAQTIEKVWEGREFIFEIRDFYNPIDLKEVQSIRDNSIEVYRNELVKKGLKPRVIGGGEPIFAPEVRIIVYGLRIDEYGVIYQYYGVTNDEKGVESVINDAKEWQKSSIISLPPEKVTLGNEHWVRLARDTATQPWYPYGAVRHLYDYYWEYPDGDQLKDWFLVEQNVDMQPGCKIWQESRFENDYLWVYNDWKSVCQLQNPTLWDRDPQGSNSGELTTSFSISGNQQGPGFAFTWAYHQPNVHRYDYTDLINQKAQWLLQFDWFSPKRTTEGFQPASSCRIDMPSAAGRYDLTYLYTQAGFKDILLYQGYAYYWWKLWVEWV